MFSRVLGASLFLYTVSLITTMAGMEIFSWLTFVIVLFGLCYKAFNGSELSALRIHRLGPDPVVWLLLGVVILGVVINGAPGSAAR